MIKIIFWLFVLVTLYVYFGYPILLKMLSFKRNINKIDEDYCPSVTLFIPLYNEETVIEEKLGNSFALDYPPDKLEIMAVSDGSRDETNTILKKFSDPRITLCIENSRSGKNACINKYVPRSKGDIIVFSDANSIYHKDAIRKLVRHFSDERVGCVCGNLQYVRQQSSVGRGEGLYFRYEAFLKDMESKHGRVVACNGAIYALRKSLFSSIPLNVPNDFAHPIEVGLKRYSVIYDKQAVATENASVTFIEEFQRRIRIVNRSYTAYKIYNKNNRILTSQLGFYFLSHKLLRWYVPLQLILLFVLNAYLSSFSLYMCLFLIQICFYLLAFTGYIFHKRLETFRLLYIPLYFCLINLAALIGIFRYYFNKSDIIWNQAKGTR